MSYSIRWLYLFRIFIWVLKLIAWSFYIPSRCAIKRAKRERTFINTGNYAKRHIAYGTSQTKRQNIAPVFSGKTAHILYVCSTALDLLYANVWQQ